MTRRIGIDVGGTKCLGVLVEDGGLVVGEKHVPTPPYTDLVETLVEMIHDFGPVDAVGVGLPGLITREGVIRSSPNLPGALDLEVGSLLSAKIGRDVAVGNDATCAALAEWTSGVAVGLNNFVMVTLGTGIGGGLVINGSLLLGAQGFAGEIGHMIIQPMGKPCGCGKHGCWERYASGTALAQALGVASGEEVFARVDAGDTEARTVLDEWSRWVGLGLANLVNVVDPEAFVLGGGLANHANTYVTDVRRHMEEAIYAARHRRVPRVLVAQLGSRAGAIGAALLTHE